MVASQLMYETEFKYNDPQFLDATEKVPIEFKG